MKHVYIGDNFAHEDVENFLKLNSVQCHSDVNEFLKIIGQGKFAIFHFSGLNSEDLEGHRQSVKILLDKLVNHCQAIIIFSSELNPEDVEFYKQYQHSNIHYFLCGFIEGQNTKPWMDWFFMTTCAYIQNPTMLTGLNPYAVKPMAFDILLGLKRYHRDRIYDYVKENNLQANVVLTYYQTHGPLLLKSKDQWMMGITNMDDLDDTSEGTSVPADYSACSIKYQGNIMPMSQIIPTIIYNQTAYTVVAETKADPGYTFYTEKIVKPIAAERLFIVFAGQHYLRNLRSLGFMTFDGIIDESYDSVEDPDIRFNMALEQMHELIDRPQEEVLLLIQPIVQHNKKLLMDTHWKMALFNGIQRIFELQ